jgi:hypothetical protein
MSTAIERGSKHTAEFTDGTFTIFGEWRLVNIPRRPQCLHPFELGSGRHFLAFGCENDEWLPAAEAPSIAAPPESDPLHPRPRFHISDFKISDSERGGSNPASSLNVRLNDGLKACALVRCYIESWLYDPSSETFWNLEDPFTVSLKMLYVNERVHDGLGGAYVWALKDDDASGAVVKAMAAGLNHH